MEIYLIRHGETRRLSDNELVSAVRGFPLEEKGHKQALKLRNYFDGAGINFDHRYSSPIFVSEETGRLLFGNGNYQFDERLTKHFHGEWEGRLKGEVYTDEVRRRIARYPTWHAPGGESQIDIGERMFDFIEDKRKELGEARIAAVTHGVPIKVLIRKILGNQEFKKLGDLEFANTSFTRLFYNGERWDISEINNSNHISNWFNNIHFVLF